MSHPPRFDATIRPAQLADMPACVEVYSESLVDMQARHNFPPSPPPDTNRILAIYQHILANGIFHVTEVQGQIAGLACANLRGRWWFLSGFWVRPGMQRSHLGMPLLRSVWQAGQQAGSQIFFVWASIDLPAMAAYFKLGMLPGCQILTFEGMPVLRPELATGYAVESLDTDFAGEIDELLLETRRQVDHDYWRRTGAQGWQVHRQGERVGYFYLDNSLVGPAAWSNPVHALPLLNLACLANARENPTVRLRIPGINHAALNFAVEAGLQLIGFSHLLLTASFGRLEQYLPSGPGLF